MTTKSSGSEVRKMEAVMVEMEPFLLTRKQAAIRYSISMRQLEKLYRRDPEFPVTRVGKKVLVFRDRADAYFTRYMRDVIESE